MLPSSFSILMFSARGSFRPNASARSEGLRRFFVKLHPFSIFSRLLLLVFFAGLCPALSGCIASVVDRSQLQAIVVSPNAVILGSVPVGKSASTAVSLVNGNSVSVNITQVSLTGQSFAIPGQKSLPISIAAGGSYSLNVAFVPVAAGPASGKLSISSSASTGATLINLSGTGAADSPPAPQLSGISCVSASMGGTGTDLCTVTISEPAPAAGFRVGLSSNNAAVTVSPAALIHASETSAQFTASFSPVSIAQAVTLTASAGTVTETFALELNVPVLTLSVGPASLAFGSLTVNTPVTESVTINSTGTGPVTISGATVTGAGFTLTSGTFPMSLNPGQTATLSVQFDPTAVGAAAGQLTVTSNSSVNATATIALNGTGEPQLTGISCSSASMGGTGTDLCTVTISAPALAAGFRVVLTSNNAAVTVSPAALIHASTTSAQFTANVSPVTTAQAVSLTASAGNATETFVLELNAPVPTLSVGPASLAFGNVTVNAPVTETVTINSTGTAPVIISAATVTGAGFILTSDTFPLSLNPGQTATLSVQFDPSAEGAAVGQLTVTSNSSVNATATIALSGTGEPQLTGISCVSASMVGTGTDLCTVTLSGTALAGDFRVGLSSSNAAVTISPAALVHANTTSAQFTAYVSPVSTAQAVTLTASAGSITETFALELNAALPNLGASPASVSFGNVLVNVTETQTVTLISTGAATVTISGATVTGAGFSLTPGAFPMSLSPGQTATLSLQFDPSAAGAAAGMLTVTSNSSASATVAIPLSGAGAGAGTFSYAGSPIEGTIVPPNPSAPISGDFFGMTILHSDTPFPAFPVATLRFWDVAAWQDVEPSSGQFDWTHMDSTVATGQENGVSDYIFTFGSVPAWASTNPTEPCTGGNGPGSCAPPDMAALADFTTNVVQRYCGTIKYYETWNEPNNPFYWSGTNAQLLAVAQQVYQIAKDPANCGCANGICAPNGGVNPNQVLMPPISHINPANLSWLDSYLAGAGASYPYADVAAFHGYGSATNPEGIVAQVQSFSQTLANHGMSNLPLWNTEASWGPLTSVDQDQASWLMRYHMALAATGVSRFVWYAYDNCGWGTLWEAPWCSDPQMPTGQVTAPGEAYGVIESWLSGASLSTCQQYENGLWACELQRAGGYDGWMLWSSAGTDIPVPIPANSGLIVYRDWQNNVDPLPTELTVTEMPVLLENHDL